MQKAEIVLSMLGRKSRDNHDYVFDRLYRNLFNPDFYVYAYQKKYLKRFSANTAALFAEDGKKVKLTPEILDEGIEKIIKKIKEEAFWPQPASKTNWEVFTASDFEDELLKEVLSLILRAIYQPLPEETDGRRQERLHRTLYEIKTKCQNSRWVITGDIDNFFGNKEEDCKKLEGLLSKKIADGRYLELIRRFFKAGHLKYEQNSFFSMAKEKNNEDGLTALLVNVYLKEADILIKSDLLADAGKETRYFRYTNKMAVFLGANKAVAPNILEKLIRRLKTDLALDLNGGVIDMSAERLKFLGYELAKPKNACTNTSVQTMRLLVPNEVISKSIRPFQKNNRPSLCPERINLSIPQIIVKYNAEIAELYDYYRLAADVNKKVGKFKFYHYYSLAKTIACKEKISVKKVIEKYGIDVKIKNGTGTRKIIGLKINGRQLTYFNDPVSSNGIDQTKR